MWKNLFLFLSFQFIFVILLQFTTSDCEREGFFEINETISWVSSYSSSIIYVQKPAIVNEETLVKGCGATYPLPVQWVNGTLRVNANCATPMLEDGSVRKCFANRRVISLGNSIGRQYAYELAFLYGEPKKTRAEQLVSCNKTIYGEPTCEILDGRGNSTITFSWFVYYNGAMESAPLAPGSQGSWGTDVCEGLYIDDCLIAVIGPHTTKDVLLLNVGIELVRNHPEGFRNKKQYRQNQVRAFIHAVNRNFKGIVIWNTVTALDPARLAWSIPFTNEHIKEFNDQVVQTVRRYAPAWNVLDGYSITKPRPDLYVDYIHYPGVLTKAVLSVMTNMVC